MLPALATIEDLEPLLPANTDVDTARANAALLAASTLVRSHTFQSWVAADDLTEVVAPDAVIQATVFIAIRVYATSDPTVTSETAGPYSVSRAAGLYLSGTERTLLRPFVKSQHQSISPASFSDLYGSQWVDGPVFAASYPVEQYL